jgi:hypothetical protein
VNKNAICFFIFNELSRRMPPAWRLNGSVISKEGFAVQITDVLFAGNSTLYILGLSLKNVVLNFTSIDKLS